jgi:hypothetical protein
MLASQSRSVVAIVFATVNPSHLVAIVAGIDVDDVGHEFEICTVLQIYRWRLEPIWVPFPILQPERHTNGAGKGLLYSATWKLYDLHFALILAYRSAVRLTHLHMRFPLRQPNLYRGDTAALTGCVREGLLANNLDRRARKAGPSNRPEATKQTISAAIHPEYFWPTGDDSAVRRFFAIKSDLRL